MVKRTVRSDCATLGRKSIARNGCVTGGTENLGDGWAHHRGGDWCTGRGKVRGDLSFRSGYTSGGQRAAKVAPNHPGAAARSQTIQCEVRIEATTASSPECVCAGVGQPIECPDFTQEKKDK